VRNFNALQANQLLQTLRQVFGLRQARAVDENWNDANAAAKRGLDLDPHEIMLIVDASPIVPVDARNPVRTDDSDERIANGDPFGQKFDKIDAGPKGAVVSFRKDKFARPDRLIAWISNQAGTVKVRPDQKLVLMRAWDDAAQRLTGMKSTLTELAALAA